MNKYYILLTLLITLPARFFAQQTQTTITQVNVLENGDFSSGNTGFYSSYSYTANNTTEGECYIGKDASKWYPDHYSCGDHTTGKGKMLLVNGSPEENRIIWKTTARIYPGRKYRFTFWITSISVPNPAIMALVINGKEVSIFKSNGKPCIWESNSAIWIPDGAASVSIALINKNTARYGNDFALDDLSFIETTETNTIASCDDKAPSRFSRTITACNQVNFRLAEENHKELESVHWNFGDGQFSADKRPRHIYQKNKTYKVTAIVKSKNGCIDSFTSNVDIQPFNVPPFKTEETEPGLIRFTTSIENANYTWNFGDNSPESNSQTASHRYKKDGGYLATLKVVNSTGCTDSSNQKINVELQASSTKPTLKINDPVFSKSPSSLPSFDTRKKELTKTFTIKQDSVRVLLSDNGIIDGDSVTLVYDGKIILTHLLLKAKPYEIRLPVSKDKGVHELIMYAENLGTIPPNTSLMIVYDGTKRYEVYIRASENSNAVVEFKRL